jgi:hypothetical protein
MCEFLNSDHNIAYILFQITEQNFNTAYDPLCVKTLQSTVTREQQEVLRKVISDIGSHSLLKYMSHWM